MFKKVMYSFSIVYFLSTIIYLILDFSVFSLIFYVLLLFPYIYFMIRGMDTPALFITILFTIFYELQCILGLIGFFTGEEKIIIALLLSIFGVFFFTNVLIGTINILRNKPLMNKMYIIIVTILYLVLLIISFVLDYDGFVLANILNIISSLSLYMIIISYLVVTNHKEIVIFK